MRWNIKLALTAVWAAVGTCGCLIMPESAPFLLPLSVLAPLLWYPRKGLAAHLWALPDRSSRRAPPAVHRPEDAHAD